MSVVEQGLQSMRVIKAFGRQDLAEQGLAEVSQATVEAALKARRVKALLSPIVAVTVAICTAIVLWRGSFLILTGVMTAGALTVFLSYLTKFFKPVQDLAKMTNSIAQAAVGVDRVRAILDADMVIPERARGVCSAGAERGDRVSECGVFLYSRCAGPEGRELPYSTRRNGGSSGPDGWRKIHDCQPDSAFL